MRDDADPLLEIVQRLQRAGVDFVLIGGLAAIAHETSGVTRDADVVAHLDEGTVVRIVTALQPLRPRWRTRPGLPVVTPDSHHLRGGLRKHVPTYGPRAARRAR